MSYKILIILLMTSVLLLSCISSNFSGNPDFSKRNYKIFNDKGSLFSSKIYLFGGSTINTNYVNAKDSLLYFQFKEDTLFIHQSRVMKVEISSIASKVLNGVLYSSLSLIFVPGFLLGLSGSQKINISGSTAGYIILGIMIASGILGAINGSEDFIFNDKENSDQIENYKNGQRVKQDSKYFEN